jgi:hypothetical protein
VEPLLQFFSYPRVSKGVIPSNARNPHSAQNFSTASKSLLPSHFGMNASAFTDPLPSLLTSGVQRRGFHRIQLLLLGLIGIDAQWASLSVI